jgi:hypothetical protein
MNFMREGLIWTLEGRKKEIKIQKKNHNFFSALSKCTLDPNYLVI